MTPLQVFHARSGYATIIKHANVLGNLKIMLKGSNNRPLEPYGSWCHQFIGQEAANVLRHCLALNHERRHSCFSSLPSQLCLINRCPFNHRSSRETTTLIPGDYELLKCTPETRGYNGLDATQRKGGNQFSGRYRTEFSEGTESPSGSITPFSGKKKKMHVETWKWF